jgi:hypothetical protein
MSSPVQRASDAEREVVAERLRAAAAEGRLDPDELDERLGAAYGARTVGDLVPLTADLPETSVPAVRGERLPALRAPAVRKQAVTFVMVNTVCIAIWAITGADYFWPVWVLLGTGIPIGFALLHAALGVGDDGDDDKDDGEPEARGRR